MQLHWLRYCCTHCPTYYKHTSHVAAGIEDQKIEWYNDVDYKMLICLANVDITIACVLVNFNCM
jgi:hypothetical protein